MGSDIIHLLPDNIANQIAAGEVIQRPASVVKELIENALDAKATNIRIEIKDAGKELIRIIDNGIGMTQSDARMAFERHATSKITQVNDLFSLHTMGFRGEALASIAAVAQVELITRPREQEVGTKLLVSASQVISTEVCTAQPGSIFSVKNLFFNVPARRKFLKSADTEQKNIIQEIEHIVLVHPEVTFEVYFDDKLHYILPESNHKIRILDTLGKRYEKDMIPISQKFPFGTIDGFIGKPEGARKRGAKEFFFVNGRFMKHPYFHKAIMKTYEPILHPGEQPNYFIYFNVDPQTIDVNIHPTKTEIKFENEQVIFKFLESMTREGLASSHAIPTIDFDVEHIVDIPAYTGHQEGTLEMPPVDVDTSYNPFEVSSDNMVDPSMGMDGTPGSAVNDISWAKLLNNFKENLREKKGDTQGGKKVSKMVSKLSSLGQRDDQSQPSEKAFSRSISSINAPASPNEYNPFDYSPSESEATGLTSEDKGNNIDGSRTIPTSYNVVPIKREPEAVKQTVTRESKVNLQSSRLFSNEQQGYEMQPVFIYKRRYLAYERQSGLALIDFRRAQIRILYDKLIKDKEQNTIEQQQLLFPEPLAIPNDTARLDMSIEHLSRVGFEIEELDDGYQITSTPSMIESSDAVDIVLSAIEAVSVGEEDKPGNLVDEMIALKMAEARAWNYGRTITRMEANKLFNDLFACPNFNYTPDGKLILLEIEDETISKKFGLK